MEERYSDEQIISILRKAEDGVSDRKLCLKHDISDTTFYTWRKKSGSMEVPKVKQLKFFEEENTRPRRCVLKQFWISRCFRWLLGTSTEDVPESASHKSHVRSYGSVAT